MQKLILLSGVSASGKSTLAREMLSKDNSLIRINRDDIRKMLYGYTDKTLYKYYTKRGIRGRESHVTEVENKMIYLGFTNGYSVIVDNTNLLKKYMNNYISLANEFEIPHEHILVDIELDEAITRDASREARVGKKVIKDQWTKLDNLIRSGVFASQTALI